MRKLLSLLLAAMMTFAMVGCSGDNTEKTTESSSELETTEGTGNEIQTTTKSEMTEENESATKESEQETTTEKQAEVQTQKPTEKPTEAQTQKPTEAPTQKPTEKPTQKPTEAPTQKPTEAPTEAPTQEPVEAPIVKKEGTVADADYKKAVSAFENIVKKMRTDGLVKSSDVCVTMDSTSIKVDITFDNKDTDIVLIKDSSTNVCTLTFDYDFMWLEGYATVIKGKDTALYNKDILLALLSIVSNEPQILFDRIDLDCFSPASLDTEKWTEIGDSFIKSGGMKVDEYISYNITKEAKDTRDSSYVLTGTTSAGKTIECVIEYDSSLVSYQLVDNGNNDWVINGEKLPSGIVTKLENVDESKIGPVCYPMIKTCTSYENYKKEWIDKYIALGDPNAEITEYNSHTVNGYTYYWFEGSFKTESEIGDPDIVYVQITENEYIQLYNVMFQERFEDFVNGSFYVKEVKIK
ncbi:MAG: PT domain-containing protein [Lachnospiraceae bacterium]|nr:PT domain-containing protein [Lachnospiraceae bacterium]